MTVFEVLIEKENIFQKLYSSSNGCWFHPKVCEMKHIERRTAEQARVEGEKYGHVRAVRKLNVDNIRGSIENIDINKGNPPKPPPDILQAKPSRFNPIALDEIIVQTTKSVECANDERLTEKVQKRRQSMIKEKQKIMTEGLDK